MRFFSFKWKILTSKNKYNPSLQRIALFLIQLAILLTLKKPSIVSGGKKDPISYIFSITIIPQPEIFPNLMHLHCCKNAAFILGIPIENTYRQLRGWMYWVSQERNRQRNYAIPLYYENEICTYSYEKEDNKVARETNKK